jgi:ABC-type branched-subunit amino acid transport system ATPase component
MTGGSLEVRELTVTYGSVDAVSQVTLRTEPGAVTGLIGPNGAGKTTLIDALCGLCRSTGQVWLDGANLSALRPHQRNERGLVRTFQSLELFEDLTVAENLSVAGAAGKARVNELLAVCGLDESVAPTSPRGLPHGHRRLVALARALASRPRVLVLDEPAAGLDIEETRRFAITLSDILRTGTSIFMVEHDMDLVMATCSLIHVLDRGRLIASGPPNAVATDPAVVAAYLGADATAGHGIGPPSLTGGLGVSD